MADEVKTIRIVVDASRAVDGSAAATRALQNIEKATGDAANAMMRIETALGRLGGFLKAQLAEMIVRVVAHIVELAKSAFDAAADLGELAEKMGITARGLQGLQYAAVQNGVALEQLETGIAKFSQKLGEAANGSKEMIEALDRIGVKILDANGKLLPTETLLQRVAQAISDIEDPAKKSAAAVEFFGKAGSKFLASLADFSKGTDVLANAAQRAGTVISDETIKKLDAVSDDMKVRALRVRAVFAELIADALDFASRNKEALLAAFPAVGLLLNIEKIGPALRPVGRFFEDTFDSIGDGLRDLVATGARFAASFIESLATIPGALKNLFLRGMDGALEAMESGINKITSGLANTWLGRQLGIDGGSVSLGRVGGSVSNSDYLANRNAQIGAAGQAAYDSVLGSTPNAADARARSRMLQGQIDADASETAARIGRLPASLPPGSSNPAARGGGGGESPEEKYARLEQQLKNTAAAQDKMTAAARAGDQAFDEAKANVDAQNKLLEIFKTQLSDADPRLKTIRDLLLDISRGKAAESFNVATTELQKQNVLLDAQIKLRNELPEVQARELALIKSKQEAEKAGNALSAGDVENRRAAIEQNERLKAQAEELKKAEELWTAPLKSALESIQRIGADAFDKFLENGKFSFDELAKVFTTTIRRMAAEFLALATIRPVMSVLVNAVSPAFAQSMGLGSTGLGGIGGSGGGMFGGGGLGGGSGLFGFLNEPIFGGGSAGPAAGLAPTGASGLAGGLTWGGGIAGAAGIGAGIYGLLTSKTPSGMVGSGLGIVGSGIGLASAAGLLPMLGAAGGPIGMGIGLLGGILASTGLLDGLLGGGAPPTITNQTYGQLSYGSGGWYTTGGAWGPSANASGTQQGLAGLGGGISSVLGLLGGVKDPSKVWGLSAMNKTVSGKDWSSSSDSTYLVDPSGNQTLWRMNEANMMDTGASQVARASILGGAVGEISANMRQVVQSIGETTSATLQELATAITAVKGFDDAIAGLNKTTTSAEQAIAQIDQQFASLYATANQYGLSVSDLDTAKAKARMGVATDFGKGLSRDILAITDPKAAALQDIEDWRTLMIDNNKWLLDNVAGAMDQIVKIEQLAGLKRAAIIEQTTNNALSGLKGSLERLLYGDLSGAAPGDVLSGTKATYTADLAKAFTGDAAAAGRLNSSSADYMQAAASYYGTSSTAYQALRRQTIIDVASAYRYQGGQFGDIPAGYDVITGNSLGGLAPAAANANYPSLTSTNGWLGSAWSNATNAWLAANPASAEISTGLAALSQQMMDVTSALQTGADNNTELVQLFNDSIALWQRIALKIAA